MSKRNLSCPVCDGDSFELDRRHFIKFAGATAAAAALPTAIRAAEVDKANPETLVKKLYDSLSEGQRVSFDEEPSPKGPRAGNVRGEG